MKEILVTGDKGFIGSHLVPALEKDYLVFGWDLKDNRDIFGSAFEDAVGGADVVIHLAAETSVNGSFDRVKDFMHLNVLGTARVAELCVKYGKKLVFPSSAAVYFRELSPYAESKALAEDICRNVQQYHPVTILRFYNVYGTNMNENSGSIMYSFAQSVVNEKQVVIFGTGEQTRDFISVRDVVQIVKAAIDSKWDGKIVDVGTGQAYTINYVAELFAHFGNGTVIYHDAPKREIKWSIAPTDLLDTLYGKPLTTNLERDIQEIVEYYGES